MKRAVIYSRVSTQEQSYQSQIEDLVRYASTNDIEISGTFSEKASDFDPSADRTEYDRMKEFVLSNSIELIICWELPRFGRNSLHTLIEIDFFTKRNVDIYFKKENIYTLSNDPVSKLVLNILSSVAEMERQTIVSRSKRGLASSALRGKRAGFVTMPYGFDADDNGYIVMNHDEAKHVLMMYEMASMGISLRKIVAKLNGMNLPTKNTSLGRKKTLRNGQVIDILWRTNTVRKILKSTLYKGERNYSGGHVIQIPQIVSEELWNRTQAIFKEHIGYVNKMTYGYLFKGKVYCGNCGYIYASRTEKRYAHLPSYYFCSARREPGIMCRSGQFDSKVFDELVFGQLFRNTKALERVYEEKAREFNIEEKQRQVDHLRREIASQDERRRRVNNLYKDGHIDESEVTREHAAIRNRIQEAENGIASILKEIENHRGFDIRSIIVNMARETDFGIKRDFVTRYVDKVKVYRVDRNDIDYSHLAGFEMFHGGHWNVERGTVLRNPHGNDKLVYVEVFAFGNPRPLKMTITNVSKQCYTGDRLRYDDGHLTLEG